MILSFLRRQTSQSKEFSQKNKKAFTLSEVLITLVVIGVIAAITIPVLIGNHQEDEKRAKVRKAYSTLANAMTFVKADGGDSFFDIPQNDAQSAFDWFDTYLKPRLITMKVCYETKGCWNESDTYLLNGIISKEPNNADSRPGIGLGYGIVSAILQDGTYITLNTWGNESVINRLKIDVPEDENSLVIFFDINGERKPNVIGKDIFCAVYNQDKGLVPAYKDADYTAIKQDCSTSGKGFSCIMKYLNND